MCFQKNSFSDLKKNFKIPFIILVILIFTFLLLRGVEGYFFWNRQIDYYIKVLGILGFLSSLFYGWKADSIFYYTNEDARPPEKANSWRVHQFWFNFISSLFGWLLIIFFIKIPLQNEIRGEDITVFHLAILLFGILGIVGLLPAVLFQITNSFYMITKNFKINKNINDN